MGLPLEHVLSTPVRSEYCRSINTSKVIVLHDASLRVREHPTDRPTICVGPGEEAFGCGREIRRRRMYPRGHGVHVADRGRRRAMAGPSWHHGRFEAEGSRAGPVEHVLAQEPFQGWAAVYERRVRLDGRAVGEEYYC